MNMAQLRSMVARAIIAAAGLALLSTSAAYAQEWKTEGRYQTKNMGPGYSNPQSIKYDKGNKVVYLDDQGRARFKLEFKNGRAYLPNGTPLDTRVNGKLERAIFVMDAEGNIYVIVKGSLEGRTHHSTVPAGKPVAAAGQIMATDGVIEYLDNHSGHYEPTNALLIQAIESLDGKGVLKGSYKVNFEHHDATPPSYLALDPQGEEKVRRGELIPYEPAGTTSDEASSKQPGGRGLSPREAYPDVPEKFYRAGMLKWNDSPLDDISGGYMKRTGNRQEFNLFPDLDGARYFARNRFRGKEVTIYELSKEDLAKTPEGREFLERVQKATEGIRADIEKLRQQGRREEADSRKSHIEELAIYLTTKESFKETVEDNARAVEKITASQVELYDENVIPQLGNRPLEIRATEPPPREVAPAPVEPDFETKIENFLNSVDLELLKAHLEAGNFDIFKNPLFRPESDAHEASEKVKNAWKKVCSKPQFAARSSLLAQMRRKMMVDIFAEVARDHGVRIELIDSGKRNAYASDIDVTVYAPEEARAQVPIAALIQDAEARFNAITQGGTRALDITLHNGDVFMPDVRNHSQSVAEYTKSLRAAVAEMRLKVANSGDASYFPGANIEDVQKRGLREGIITELNPEVEVVRRAPDGTVLETKFKKPQPKTYRASEFGPAGDLKVDALRFSGLKPAYDRSNALGALSQNLEKIYRSGDKPAEVAKLFNRGMELGAGAGEVNSYLNLHTSDLPPSNTTPEEAAKLALEIEQATLELAKIAFTEDGNQQRKLKLKQLDDLRQRSRNKDVAKMRWIIRSFGYRSGNVAPQNIIWLYDLLNTTADMEVDKAKGNFDFEKMRIRYLQRYFTQQAGLNPDLARTREGADKLFEMAWRDVCEQMVDATEIAMVKRLKEALDALRPEAIKEFAHKGRMVQGGKVVGSNEHAQAQEQAKKIAEKIRTEIVLLFDFINTKSNPDALELTEKQLERALEQKERVQALREAILENMPDALKPEVEKLDKIARTQMKNYLQEFDEPGKSRPQTPEKMIEAKEAAVKRVAEVGPEEAERSVTKEALKEHIKNIALMFYNPKDGPLAQQVLDVLTGGLHDSITGVKIDERTGKEVRDTNTGEKVYDTQGKAFVEQLKANLSSPLMVGSSAVSIARAYVAGGERAAVEAAVGEAFNLLPPAYGLIGIAFKDFARGNISEGLHSIKWLAGIHLGEKLIPGAGQALLAFNIATGVPQIIYLYTTQKINEDLIEQAMRSYPAPGKRAARNPYKDSTDLFRGDTPNFPIFWDNPCMKEPDDKLSIRERFPIVAPLYATEIGRELKYSGLSPDEIKEIEKKGEKYENPNLKPGTPEWHQARLHLFEKYAFDHPYYQRIKKIYDCYFPQVKAQRDKGFDEDNVLKHVFGKVVEEWFHKQDVGYQMEFSFDLGRQTEHGDAMRKQMLARITNYVIAQYKWYEYEPMRRQWQMEQAAKALAEQAQRPQVAEKQLIATKKRVADRIEQSLATHILSALSQSETNLAPSIRIKAPTWYVGMKGIIKGAAGDKSGITVQVDDRNVADVRVEDKTVISEVLTNLPDDDPGHIPIDVEVRAHRASGKLLHDFKLALASPADAAIKRGAPAGFIPNAEERKLLGETGPDGKPKNDIFTINMVASANIFDDQRTVLAQSKPVPVVGYVIAEVPRFRHKVALLVNNEKTPEARSGAFIPFEARLGKEVKRGDTNPLSRLGFEDLPPGTYQVTVTPLSAEFGPASATFTISDPYTKAALESKTIPKNPDTIEVTLPYKAPAAVNKPPDNQPGQDPNKTGVRKIPVKPGEQAQGNQSGADNAAQKAVQECQQLTGRAMQSVAAGDTASATALLQQARQMGCAGIDPSVGQAIEGIQRALDDAVRNKGSEIQQKSAQCEYEEALRLATELMRTNPGHPALAAINIAELQALAASQRSARVLLQNGKTAIERGNLDGAIAALQGALAVPNLPECMRRPATDLLGELNGRRRFGELSPQVDPAIKSCDYKEAARIVGLINNIQPRSATIRSWLNEYAPKVAALQNQQREAIALIQQASAAARTATTAEDRQRIRAMVEEAKQKVAPCQLSNLDPTLTNLVDAERKPQVEELPEDADRPTPGTEPKNKPRVEELPEDADKPIATAGSKPKNRPEVEELPEDADRTVAKAGNEPRRQPKVEEIPDDANRPGERAGRRQTPQPNTGRGTPPASRPPRQPERTSEPSGGSDGDYGNLTGTWVLAGQDGDDYWKVRLPLRRVGKNTWQGEATSDTSVVPCSAESFLVPVFAGSATVIATGPGVFRLILRGKQECGENEGRPFEVHWGGTFTSSQMILRFKQNGQGHALSRQ